MATASPSRVAVFMTKMDMLVARPRGTCPPRVTVTARPPVMTGSAADTRLPNTKMSAMSATGSP